MLLPALTGSGASPLEMARTGLEVTVVLMTPPAAGAVSVESMPYVLFVMTVPLARGLATCTTSWTDEDEPAFSAPMFQVTTPAASVPPAVADTKVVFAGIVSVITTPLALALPVFEYDSVYVMLPPAFTGSGASVFEIERIGADDTVVVMAEPAVGAVSLLSMP